MPRKRVVPNSTLVRTIHEILDITATTCHIIFFSNFSCDSSAKLNSEQFDITTEENLQKSHILVNRRIVHDSPTILPAPMNFLNILCIIGLFARVSSQVDTKASKAAYISGKDMDKFQNSHAKSSKDTAAPLDMSVGAKSSDMSGKTGKTMCMSMDGGAKSWKEASTNYEMSMDTAKSGKPKSSKTMSLTTNLRGKTDRTNAKMSKSPFSMPLN